MLNKHLINHLKSLPEDMAVEVVCEGEWEIEDGDLLPIDAVGLMAGRVIIRVSQPL